MVGTARNRVPSNKQTITTMNLPTDFSARIEINTPIALEEKQHLVKMFGMWASVFSYVGSNGKRKFKVRKFFASAEEASADWLMICENYA